MALAGLRDKSKLVRWRAARVLGELGKQEQEAELLEAARAVEAEFEVAFEMADAARKIKARVAAVAGGEDAGSGAAAAPGVASGPVWKQIQEGRSASQAPRA